MSEFSQKLFKVELSNSVYIYEQWVVSGDQISGSLLLFFPLFCPFFCLFEVNLFLSSQLEGK